ncbi:MAG TPA: ribosome-associated translation inhibitor RaiA [Alphaproteobacteria bacterium]|nr:ribosome-associated translation inhibitor RaiA [Alphaproteobacteria bacterium]
MQLSVKGKQLDVGDTLRSHVADNLAVIASKYFGNPIEASVVFSREARLYRADLSVHIGRNILLQSNADADDAYLAFDAAADRMSKRLRRHKRRLKDHHRNNDAGPVEMTAQAYVLDGGRDGTEETEKDDESSQPVVVAEMTMPIETMSVSDAVMRLDLGDMPAFMFRNGAHGGLNMVYRRSDGNIGWVDPRDTRAVGA